MLKTLTGVTCLPEALSPAQGGVHSSQRKYLSQEAQPEAGLSLESQRPPGAQSLTPAASLTWPAEGSLFPSEVSTH